MAFALAWKDYYIKKNIEKIIIYKRLLKIAIILMIAYTPAVSEWTRESRRLKSWFCGKSNLRSVAYFSFLSFKSFWYFFLEIKIPEEKFLDIKIIAFSKVYKSRYKFSSWESIWLTSSDNLDNIQPQQRRSLFFARFKIPAVISASDLELYNIWFWKLLA